MMMSFYSRTEAAAILQCSPTTISKYIRNGTLKNYGTPKKIKLSTEEIHSFYETVKSQGDKVSRTEVLRLQTRVNTLESEMETLKMIVGVGTLKPPRTDHQLQSLHEEVMILLTQVSWDVRTIMSISDTMISLKDKEVLRLVQIKGTRSWTGLFDLSERMLHYIGSMALPKATTDILVNRLESGRNRLYGLLYVSLSEHIAMDKYWAKRIVSSRVIDQTTDEFLVNFLSKRAQQ